QFLFSTDNCIERRKRFFGCFQCLLSVPHFFLSLRQLLISVRKLLKRLLLCLALLRDILRLGSVIHLIRSFSERLCGRRHVGSRALFSHFCPRREGFFLLRHLFRWEARAHHL